MKKQLLENIMKQIIRPGESSRESENSTKDRIWKIKHGADSSPNEFLPVQDRFSLDLHLGTPWCKVKSLVRFLSSLECERLYLVGDIIDGWKAGLRPEWPHPSVRHTVHPLPCGQDSVTYIPETTMNQRTSSTAGPSRCESLY